MGAAAAATSRRKEKVLKVNVLDALHAINNDSQANKAPETWTLGMRDVVKVYVGVAVAQTRTDSFDFDDGIRT